MRRDGYEPNGSSTAARIPWWVVTTVILGALLTASGGILALVRPEMLVGSGASMNQAASSQVALQRWLLKSFPGTLSTNGSKPALVAIVNQQVQPLAAVSCDSSKAVSPGVLPSGTDYCSAITATEAGVLLSPRQIQAVIAAALEGISGPYENRITTNQTIHAVPIMGEDRQVLGAFVALVNQPIDTTQQAINAQNIGELFQVFLQNLQPAGWFFVLLATVLGKLHLADRTRAAVFAWRQGMMDR
jgi:hypothetical protein